MGLNADDIRMLYTFFDYVLSLPPELEGAFMTSLKKYEETINMPYITSAERIGKEQGIQIGIEHGIGLGIPTGSRKILQLMIEKRFGGVSARTDQLLANATANELEQIAINFLSAKNEEDLFHLAQTETVTV